MPTEAMLAFAGAAHPLNWYEVAKLMHAGAVKLYESEQGHISRWHANDGYSTRRETNRPVFLLAAFAMENLLKAYLVFENPHYIEGGKLAKALLNRHGLAKLQMACLNVPAPKRTRFVFEALEVGVSSWARYPCAISIEYETSERDVTPELWTAYVGTFEKYSAKLEKLLSRTWQGAYGEVSRCEFQ